MLRPVRLTRIAADAEILRWRAFAARTITRIVCALIALIFVIGVLTIAHVAAWLALRVNAGLQYYWVALILGGVDLIIALVLLLIASRSTPSKVEREALEVRQRAVAGLTTTLSLAQLALPMLRVANSARRRTVRR
ncbi:MAG: hypothetical protein ACJ8AI_25210 [Rhodopila sp.]